MQHVPYPSTPSFANFKLDYIHALGHTPTEQQAQSTESSPHRWLPKQCTFVGTVKLHGTNASIVFKNGDKANPQIQSRSRVVTEQQDNNGTCRLLSTTPLSALVDEILRIRDKGPKFSEIFIAGEMAGKGIQKGVALVNMQPFFAIFNLRIDGKWVDVREYKTVALPDHRIFNLAQYRTFEVQIDFERDTAAVGEEMTGYTAEVCAECPFSAAFVDAGGKKISGPGEGIVWTMVRPKVTDNIEESHFFDDTMLYNFKTKGDKFSTTRAPRNKGAPTSEAAVQFVEYALAERRLEQGIEYLEEEQERKGKGRRGYDWKLVGAFIKWVSDDTIKEERNEMERLGVSEKDARRELGIRAREWYTNIGKLQ